MISKPPSGEALLSAPVGANRFVIRATHERGVGVPSSRSLSTASREAKSVYDGLAGAGHFFRRFRFVARFACWRWPRR
jgi:hypothetical protein